MKSRIASLVVFAAICSSSLAAPFTLLTAVYRYTKLPDGIVSVEGGSLYSSGDYTASFTTNYPAVDLAAIGLDAVTLAAISGKFLTGADYIDSELATAEGRDRLSNYSFSANSYSTDQGNMYLVSAGGFSPDVPTINVTVTKSTIKEGGKPSAIVLKLNKPATDELIVRYTLGGKSKIKSDYTSPSAKLFVEIPKGKTTFRIPVRPVNDKFKESAEDLVFKLTKNDGYKIGKKKTVNIRIRDND